MKRPAGVILTALFAILGSLLFVLLMAIESIVFIHPPQGAAIPDEARLGLVFGAAIFGVMAVWGITTGVGLFRLKNWARISQIVFSVMLALLALVSAPVLLVIPTPPNVPGNFHTVMQVVASVYAAFGLLGIAWIVYFTRPKVKTAFAGADVVRSGRPLSISIIGWWLLVSGLFTLPFAFFHSPIVLMGWIVKGWAATATMIVLGVVYTVIGFELLKLNETARLSAIGLQLFFIINGVLMAVLPGSQQRFMEAMRASPFMTPNARVPALPAFPTIIFLFTIPMLAVPLWFLFTRKKAFEHPSIEGGTPTPA